MGLMIIVSFTAAGILSYTGAELGRTGRVNRAISARNCAEAGIQRGRLLLAQNIGNWNKILSNDPTLSANLSGLATPDSPLMDTSKFGTASLGRVDGEPTSLGKADFMISVSDDFDEVPPNPLRDNNLQVILRSECIRSGSSLGGPVDSSTLSAVPSDIVGAYRNETASSRKNIVIEARVSEVPPGSYQGQARGGASGGPGAI